MVLLKRSIIAASALLLSVGIFTSCSEDDGNDGYLSCTEAGEKMTACYLENDATADVTACIQEATCGGNSQEECAQHYEQCDFSEGEGDFLGCDELIVKVSAKGCTLVKYPSVEKMMACAIEEELQDDICGEASAEDCQKHYLDECAGGSGNPSSSGTAGSGEFLTCEQAEAKQMELLECGTDLTCMNNVMSALCGDNSQEECQQHYIDECGTVETGDEPDCEAIGAIVGSCTDLECLNALSTDNKNELCGLVGFSAPANETDFMICAGAIAGECQAP